MGRGAFEVAAIVFGPKGLDKAARAGSTGARVAGLADDAVRLTDDVARAAAYDAAGRPTGLTDPAGSTWTRAYDLDGHLAEETGPDGATARYQYGGRGFPVRIEDGAGEAAHLTWNADGQLAAETDRTGATTRYGYDALGRLTRRTDAEGGETLFVYDGAGRLLRLTARAPGDEGGPARTTRFRYDAAGNVAEITDPDGAVRRFTHHPLFDLVTSTAQPSGATTRFGYDADGDLATVTDATGRTWSFARDLAGQIVEEWQEAARGASGSTLPALTERAVVQSAYDVLGHRVGCTTPSGRGLSFGHDAEGRLVAVSDEHGPIVRYALDRLGRAKRRAIGGGPGGAAAVGLRSYTAFGELAEQRLVRDAEPGRVGLAELFRRTYAHDEAGRLRQVDDSRWPRGLAAGASVDFRRDADGWLTSSVDPVRGLEAYTADAAGNVPAAPVRLSTPPRPDGGEAAGGVVAVSVAEGWTLGYDADGTLLSKRDASGRHGGVAWRYAYDAAGRLAEVWRDGGGGEERVGRYRYDPFGRRVTREAWTPDGAGVAERTVWCGDVPAERRRTRLPGAHEGASTGAVDVRAYVFPGFEPVALLDGRGEGALVVECDHVGQPRLAVDREGGVVWEGRFGAQGRDVETAGRTHVDLRFPGQTADAESGLRYNRFRYYDPNTRAYTRADPAGVNGGFRPHNYVPDPTAWTDPLGLTWRPKGPGTLGNPNFPDVVASTGPNRAPDFAGTKHLLPTQGAERNVVKIKLQGTRTRDFTQAYKAAGISGKRRAAVKAEYTWHHLDDFDPVTGESSMQLVKTEAHIANTPIRVPPTSSRSNLVLRTTRTTPSGQRNPRAGWRAAHRNVPKRLTLRDDR